MKKILNLLSILTISGTTIPTLIANCSYQKNDIKDLFELNWTGLNKTKSKKDTKNKKTKHIFKTNGADKPTKQQIKEAIIELNPQLDTKNINVTNITENSAVITIIGFEGQRTIDFLVDKSLPINEIITITNLEKYLTNNFSELTEQEMKNRIKEKNPQLDTTKINITNITKTSATITSNDTNFYSGKIEIKTTELGSIKTNGADKPTTIPSITTTSNYKNQKKNNNSEIKNKTNEKNKHLEKGYSSNGQTENTKTYKLKKWKDYVNSIEELKKTFQYLSFKDLNIEINGQGTTVTTQRLTINLSDIATDPNELKTITISKYSFYFIFAEQTADVEIIPYFSGDYIYGKFIFKTYSFMSVYNISINFELNNQILCNG